MAQILAPFDIQSIHSKHPQLPQQLVHAFRLDTDLAHNAPITPRLIKEAAATAVALEQLQGEGFSVSFVNKRITICSQNSMLRSPMQLFRPRKVVPLQSPKLVSCELQKITLISSIYNLYRFLCRIRCPCPPCSSIDGCNNCASSVHERHAGEPAKSRREPAKNGGVERQCKDWQF
jgi:hypothetical protein